jgi:hypothetical protein
MAIVTVGIDLAKNVFAVHGVDENDKPVLDRPEVTRAKLLQLICIAAMLQPGQADCRRPTMSALSSYNAQSFS